MYLFDIMISPSKGYFSKE